MNSITICGNVGKDPELTFTQSGRPVCKFSVADTRPKDREGNEQTQWFNCRAFDRTAELINEHFGKGKPIWVTGILHARQYDRQDGTQGMALDVQVTSFDFVPFGGSKRKEDDPAEPTPPTPRPAQTASQQPAVGTDDVPEIYDPFADE